MDTKRCDFQGCPRFRGDGSDSFWVTICMLDVGPPLVVAAGPREPATYTVDACTPEHASLLMAETRRQHGGRIEERERRRQAAIAKIAKAR